MARQKRPSPPPRRKAEQAASAAGPGPDRLVIALSVLGAVIAGYLTWTKWSGHGAALCVAGTGCDIVQASRYALFLGVPTALWGAVLYAAIAVLAFDLTRRRWLAAFVLAAAGIGFSAYLTALSIFVLKATCMYCLLSAAILLALLVVLLRGRPRPAHATPSLRPARLTAYGGLAAVVTVLFGAFVFAAPSAAPPGFPEALARHLKQTGAVMYGAYW